MFDVIDKIISGIEGLKDGVSPFGWISKIITDIAEMLHGFICSVTQKLWDLTFYLIDDLAQIPGIDIQPLISFTTNIATYLFSIMFLKQVFENYVIKDDSDDSKDSLQSLVNLAFALAITNCGTEIFYTLDRLSQLIRLNLKTAINLTKVTSDSGFSLGITKLTDRLSYVFNYDMMFESLKEMDLAASVPTLICLLWVCVAAVMVFFILLKLLFRAAELLIFRILFPLFCVDLITQNKELFKQFMTAYLKTIFGYLIQYLCVELAIGLMIDMKEISTSDIAGNKSALLIPIISTGLLYFGVKSPQWLERFTYSNTGPQGVRSTIHTVKQIFGRR